MQVRYSSFAGYKKDQDVIRVTVLVNLFKKYLTTLKA
jgi:hypothetical protein